MELEIIRDWNLQKDRAEESTEAIALRNIKVTATDNVPSEAAKTPKARRLEQPQGNRGIIRK